MNQEILRENFQSIIANYPHAQAALAPLLHTMLENKCPLSSEAIALLAELCETDTRRIAEIIAYYPIFQNGSSNHTEVCFGLPCYLNGATEVFEYLKEANKNGNNNGSAKSTTRSPCLGHCYAAPVIRMEDGSLCRADLSVKTNKVGATRG